MNIILFENGEIGKPLPRRDERTVHLLKVLHKQAGDTFDAGVFDGLRGTGKIEAVRRDGSLEYSLDLRLPPPPKAPVRVGVGFPRPIQLRRLLRDLSSLGVEAIDLLGTELGEKSYRDTKLLSDGGARAALVEGAVQSRDTVLPEIRVYPDLAAWLAERPWDRGQALSPLLVAADNVRPEGTFSHLVSRRRPMTLAAGSERGWSDAERDRLEQAGFVRLSLGKRALRTETACVAAVVLALEKTGELE
ncbi:MAG: 16S rRNA (uracil(1498)-N(3))-methyltransferase [Spirochaetaceae bacterium]|jgi:RsmE family RNA methyltransferase|nr:16S rRNA (uracil(1498)-N(3))-methyltransferase [Spirochaetaceae bacterium]